MRQHLQRTRQIEAAIRTDLLRRNSEASPSPAERVLVELLDVRLSVIDKLLGDFEREAELPFSQAMERLRLHFDKDSESPYRVFRGPTPVDVPSLAKDVVIVFETLSATGQWGGACPVLDPKWTPL